MQTNDYPMVTIDGFPVFDVFVTDEDTGMLKISLVDEPAVMKDFLAFDSHRRMQMYSVQDEEKRLLLGVVARANFPIYRKDERLGEYFIVFKPETIRKMAEKYLAESRQNNVNLMHGKDTDVEGVQMVQWFIQDSGKGIVPAGFDVPDGSLFAEFHVLNDEVWKAVKEGTYKGFSLEGFFDMAPEHEVQEVADMVEDCDGMFSRIMKKAHSILNETNMSKIDRFKAALAKFFAALGNVSTDKGVLSWDGDEDLKAGDEVFILDGEGNRAVPEDGDYITTDAKTIVVAEGRVAEIKDPEAEVETEFGKVDTDKGILSWEGEEDLKAGDAVFIDGNPAPDGEYQTEDGKVIVVVDGVVAEIKDPAAEVGPEEVPDNPDGEIMRKENQTLRAQVEELTRKVEELSRMSAAKPAHEEVQTSAKTPKTGNKGMDRLARYLDAVK